jgi:hypothetical protein
MEILPGGKDIAVFTEHVFQRWVDPVENGKLEPFKTTKCAFIVPPPRCCKVSFKFTYININSKASHIHFNKILLQPVPTCHCSGRYILK